VRRLWGADRVLTAVALSRERASARTVVVVPSRTHAEALIAAPLAGLVGAPVLLSSAEGLDAAVAAEVRRLGAVNAYVIGRPDQLSARVEDDLRAAGVANQARLSAPDSPSLSAEVARETASYPALADGVGTVFLALGESADPSRAWPDALSVSALAADLRAPILLVRGDELPAAVADVLAELDPDQVEVIGGAVAISEDVARAAGATARLFGEDRYGTSVAVAQEARRQGLGGTTAWLATGRNFPDALAAGPAAARADGPLVLVDGVSPEGSVDTYGWLTARRDELAGAVLVGGEDAVSDPVSQAVARVLGR
jgi:putative cell wall-binding protein